MTSKTFFRIILVALTFIISGSIYPLYTVIKTSNLFNPCKENPNLIGDGFCDDSANSEKCSFDGGDCCLINVLRDFCVECDCHYQKFQTTETTKSISSSSITTQLITSSTTSILSSTEFQGDQKYQIYT